MTTQAKYGWAVGLILAGLVGALPFRHHKPREVADAGTETEIAQPEKADSSDSKPSGKSGNSLADSHLLPQRPQANEKLADNSKQINPAPMMGQEDGYPNAGMSPTGKMIPKRLDLDRMAPGGIPEGELVQPERNVSPPVAMEPENYRSNPGRGDVGGDSYVPVQPPGNSGNVLRQMPESVGPYRMKPVPSGRYLSRERSERAISSRSLPPQTSLPDEPIRTRSRKREVIQYRLRDGDSLRSIAQRYLGDASRYQDILEDNRHLFTNGEKFLPVGQYITIVID